MKRTIGAMALAAAMSGCVATEQQGPGSYMSQATNSPVANPSGVRNGAYQAMNMPGYQGPDGSPLPMTRAMVHGPQTDADAAARSTLAKALPPELYQQVVYKSNSGGSGVERAGGMMPPMPGLMPPGNFMQTSGVCGPNGCQPGMQGMGGMGMTASPTMGPPGAVAAVGALTGGNAAPFKVQRTEVRFVGPAGMRITWFVPGTDGKNAPSTQYLEAPGRYNFLQAAIYRLKLSDIPNRAGVELYPTLEVVPASSRAQAFLAHSAVPVSFTEEDLEQVASGNYVVKVIYLPDPQFQDLASTGPDEVVSSRLEPGQDPIAEAHRRGSILLVVRLGNIDLEAPNTPAMDAPNANQKNTMSQGTLPQGMASPSMMPPQLLFQPKGVIPPGTTAPGKVPTTGKLPGTLPQVNGLPAIPVLPTQPMGPGKLPSEQIPVITPDDAGKDKTGPSLPVVPPGPNTSSKGSGQSIKQAAAKSALEKKSIFDIFRSK